MSDASRPRVEVEAQASLCLRVQLGCGMRGWARDGLGAGPQGRRREGAEGFDKLEKHLAKSESIT